MWETTVSAAWVGAREKVRLCPSILGIRTLGWGVEVSQASVVDNATSMLAELEVVHFGYTQMPRYIR